jgi:drug/metabolite transporter (DMT)-like permease
MNNIYVCLILNIFLLVAGQCIWKTGMGKIDEFSIVNLMASWYMWLGIILYGIATILWLKVLSAMPLSIAYPAQSMAYVMGIFFAYLFFGEPITISKVIGSLLIACGVVVISILN